MPLDELLDGLHEAEDVSRHCDAIDRAVAGGRAQELHDLALALRDGGPGWQHETVLEHIQEALALTPGDANVACLVRLIATDPHRPPVRLAAAQLAAAQPVEFLLPLYDRPEQAPELLACLVQELVLRHPGIGRTEQISRAAERLAAAHHPLAALPTTLLPFEDALDLPSYGLRGSSYAMPFGPSPRTGATRPPRRRVAAAELLTPGLMTAAVDNWVNEPDGRVEARAFRLAAPAGLDAALLDGLGLACLDGDGELTVRPGTPSEVMRVLFAAAATGSAYGGGRGGAYGRLAAWQSMTALAGGRIDDAPQWSWLLFDAVTRWYGRVAWDIGIAALDRDRLLLHVLAATDAD